MIAGGEHCQLRAAIEVLVSYTPGKGLPTIRGRVAPAHGQGLTSCTLQVQVADDYDLGRQGARASTIPSTCAAPEGFNYYSHPV